MPQGNLLAVRDYLASEADSASNHEFVDGLIYAKPAERSVHNGVARNLVETLGIRLHDNCHWPFNSDTKIRIRMRAQTRFYYPDVSVVCRPNPPHDSFQDEPAAIVEVLSRRTRRIDEGEKKDAYLTIPSLNVYLLVEQDAPLVTVFRRNETGGFVREVYDGLDAVIPLGEIEIDLPLAEIYAGVAFISEASNDENA